MASRRTRWEIAQPIAEGADYSGRTSRIRTDRFPAQLELSIKSETVLPGIRDTCTLRRGREIVKRRPYEQRPTKGTTASSWDIPQRSAPPRVTRLGG